MIIYIGADHGGFALKANLKDFLKNLGYEVFDVGANELIPGDDYPDYAKLVGQKISESPTEARGILICRSGVGMDVVANKFKDVRSAVALSADVIYQARHDDDINVISFAADFTDISAAENMIKIFLSTPFANDERYTRRLEKIEEIES